MLNALIQGTDQISNSSYDKNSQIPWGIQSLTLPLHHATKLENAGTRIDDFYHPSFSAHYFENLGKQIIIFNQVTQQAMKSSENFIAILTYLIIVFIILSVTISAILTNLILFENQRIIVLLKSIGYRLKEIEWYLIAGYLIATLFAVGTGIGLSVLFFEVSKNFLTTNLGFSLYFIWSWQYILTFIALGLVFWLMVKITSNIFSKHQKATKLFEEK